MDNPMIGGSGLLQGSAAAGILDLDSSIHQRHHPQPQPHFTAGPLGLDSDRQMATLFDPLNPAPAPAPSHHKKGGIPPSPAAAAAATTSDEEDHLPGYDYGHDPASGRIKKGSPWQRMKWTDEVVRLLISLVAYVGDHEDGTLEGLDTPGGGGMKRKHGTALQKKGKWKMVSKLMLDNGCYVSPQQCEDKFNDLNKRYKRLNEILGWGTSCQVVENPALLDSMPHISPKAKDDVRKILSSKHLFYREMCAYHNGQRIPNCHDIELQGCSLPKPAPLKDSHGHADEEEDEDDEDDNGDDEERSDELGKRELESFRAEMNGVIQDSTKSPSEQREWFKRRSLQLEEERLEMEAEALELQKQLFKWQRFRSKKDWELERSRLENERLMLENERIAVQVRYKEQELDFRLSREALSSAGFSKADGEQERDPMELLG